MSCLVTKLQGVVDNPNLPKFKELTLIARRYGVNNNVTNAGVNYENDSSFAVYSCEYVSQDNPLCIKIPTNITIISVAGGTVNVTTNEVRIDAPNIFCIITYNFNTTDHNDDFGYITINNKYLVGGLAGCTNSIAYIYRIFLLKSSDLIGMKNLHFINGIHLDHHHLINAGYTVDDCINIKKLAIKEIYNTDQIYSFFQPYWITGDLSDLNFSNTKPSSFYISNFCTFTWSDYMNSSLYNSLDSITYTLNPMNAVFNDKDFSKANFSKVWFNSTYAIGVKIKWTATSKAARGRDFITVLNGVAMEPTDMHNYLLCAAEYTNLVNLTGDYACIKIYTAPDYNISNASANIKSAINTILERNVRIIINSVNITTL